MRSSARVEKSERSKAIKDQKAVCAIVRSFEPNWSDQDYPLKDAVTDVLVLTTKEKLAKKAARPHFTVKEPRFTVKERPGQNQGRWLRRKEPRHDFGFA